MSFHFRLANAAGSEPIFKAIGERDEALACAQRLAIDLAEERQDLLGQGYAVVVIDDAGEEIHREHIDSADKHG